MCEPKPILAVFLGLACACEPKPAPPPSAPAADVPVASASAAPLAIEPPPPPSEPADEGDPGARALPPEVEWSRPGNGPTQADPPFDRGRAAAALGAVNVQRCASATGPRGPGRVKITFGASDGRARAVIVDPPYAGTAVGICIVGRFRGANVLPFSGADVTVGKSFTVN